MPNSKHRILARTVLPYAVFSALWIAFSDRLLAALATDTAWLTHFQTYKELAYILVTALLLYWLLRRELDARERAEGEQQQLHDRLIGVLESMTDGFVALDKDWRYTYVNRRAAEMFGRRPGDLIGKHIWTEFPEGVDQPFYRAYHKAMTEQTPVTLEDYYAPWDRWFENRIWPAPDGLYIFFQEITARKRTETALRESTRTLTTLISNLPGLIYRCRNDQDWTTEFISDGVFPLTEYSPMDFKEGKVQLGQLIHPDDREPVWNAIQTALKVKQPYTLTYRLHTASGQEKWVWEQGQGIFSSSGEFRHLEGFITDISDRKQAEAALRQSEQRLRDLIDGLGPQMFVGLMTPKGTLIEVNRPALAAAGLKPEDVLGKQVEQSYWWSYSEEAQQRLRATVVRAAQGEASRYDAQVRVGENQFIYIDFSLQPLRDGAGKVQYLIGSANVITERKLAEQALREREHFLQRVLDTEPGTVYLYDLVTRRNVFINRHWLSAYGYTAEETQAMGEALLARITHPDDLARIVTYHAAWRPAPDGVTRDIEYRIRGKDGAWYWLHSRETAFARDPAGHVTQILGIAHDITERKTAETALAERDALLNETGRVAKVGGWEFDPVTGKGSWTDEVARIHDLDPSAETSVEIGLGFYHGEHRAAIERAVREAVESGKPYDLELELISAKGVRKWVRTIGNPRVEHDRVVRVSGSFQDITDRKQAEATLRENARQLETLSRRLLAAQEDERRRVARELHDELGQALTVIKINLQARERLKDRAPAGIEAENIRLVDDTLQQVRRLALALRPSMLDDLGLGSALRWMADQQAERSGFAMHFGADFSDTRLAPELETACFRIAQEALTNIARHAQARRVAIELRHEGDALAMTILDDGRGFDVVAMRTRAKTGGSIGVLGMQERAALAGGRLEIESAPGQGTTVRARMPWRVADSDLEASE